MATNLRYSVDHRGRSHYARTGYQPARRALHGLHSTMHISLPLNLWAKWQYYGLASKIRKEQVHMTMQEWAIDEWVPSRKSLKLGETIQVYSRAQKKLVDAEVVLWLDTGFTLAICIDTSHDNLELLICIGTQRILSYVHNSNSIVNPSLTPAGHWESVSNRAVTNTTAYLDGLKQVSQSNQLSHKSCIVFGSNRLGDSLMQLNWLLSNIDSLKEGGRAQLGLYIAKQGLLVDPRAFIDTSFFEIHDCETLADAYNLASLSGATSVWMGNMQIPENPQPLSDAIQRYASKCNQSLSELDSKFILVISLELEKRIWLNQVEVLRDAIKAAANSIGAVHVVLFGMCKAIYANSSSLQQVMNEENRVFSELINGLGEVSHISLSGMTLEEKLPLLSMADFFVAPLGSPTTILSHLLRIPGMAVCNTEFRTNSWYTQAANKATWLAPLEFIEDDPDRELGKGDISQFRAEHPPQLVSYSVNKKLFIEKFLEYIKDPDKLRPSPFS